MSSRSVQVSDAGFQPADSKLKTRADLGVCGLERGAPGSSNQGQRGGKLLVITTAFE
jgi:hypothetical protein